MNNSTLESKLILSETQSSKDERFILDSFRDLYEAAGWKAVNDLILSGASFSQVKSEIKGLGLDAFFIPENSIPDDNNLWTFQDQPSNPVYKSWCRLLSLVQIRKRRLLIKKRRYLRICDRVAEKVNRTTMMKQECIKLSVMLGVDIEESLVDEYLRLVWFNPNLPLGQSSNEEGLHTTRVVLADPVSYPSHFLLLEACRDEDIAVLRHEFVHYLKDQGVLKHDIGIPIAAAIHPLSLKMVVANNQRYHGYLKPLSYEDIVLYFSEMSNIEIQFGGNLDATFCSFVFDLSKTIVDTYGYKSLIEEFRKKDQLQGVAVTEPPNSYVYGRRLAYFVKWVTRYYQINEFYFLGRLALGHLPSEIIEGESTTQPSDREMRAI